MRMAGTSVVTVQQAIAEIEDYIRKNGGPYSAWYCGVASDPRDRLFNQHGVSEQGGIWIWRPLSTDTEARQVEAYFLRKGCDGGPGGGDRYSRFVYAYMKTSYTRP
jgi:hypothetical protein